MPLHLTNGDAVVPDIVDATGGEDVLPWRDVLHDGPIPRDLGVGPLARVRAAHLAARGWTTEAQALAELRARDGRLAAHPPDAEIVLWFEDDLYDWLQLAQIDARLVGRPGPMWRVRLPHDRRGVDLAALPREPHEPRPEVFAALRSPDPRAWLAHRELARLVEELPEATTGLGRLERQIVDALRDGPLDRRDLFVAVAAQEDPPWISDWPLWALADELAPIVERRGATYVVVGEPPRRPPPNRMLGGVHVADWAFDAASGSVLAR